MIEILLVCTLVGMWYNYMEEFHSTIGRYRKTPEQQLHRRIVNSTNKVNYYTRKEGIDDLGLHVPRRQEDISRIIARDLHKVQQLAKRHQEKLYGKHLASLCCAYDLWKRTHPDD